MESSGSIILHLAAFAARALRNVSFRGKTRLLSSLCPRDAKFVFNLNGVKMDLDLNDHIQRKMFLYTDWKGTAHMRTFLQQGMTVVDVGARACL
jgi:hypothetical protein